MVYKFFDKKSAGSGVNTKLAPQNQQLAEELHKTIIKKFEKRKVHAALEDNIWGAGLADMQLLNRYNKGIRFLLLKRRKHCCSISKYFKTIKYKTK